jgi:spermidine/putrescine transport system substrate-binding protein
MSPVYCVTYVSGRTHIDADWQNAFAAARGYAVPYFWGTLGIGYRTDLVPEKIVSWKQFYRPSERLRGKLGMIKSSRDVIGMALKALGYSANSSDPKQLAEAEQLLRAQKPYVGDYTYIDLDEKSELVTGKIVASMMYSGDALMVKEHHPEIVYVLPEEGGNLWVDYWTVMNRSQIRELAMAFINFLNQPKIAARLAEFVYYATPNKAAEKLMSEEFLQDPTIYPNRKQLEKSEFYTKLPPRASKKRNRIFNDIVR